MSSCVSWLLTAKLRPFSAFYIFFLVAYVAFGSKLRCFNFAIPCLATFLFAHVVALPFPFGLNLIVYLERGTVLL